MPGSLPPAPINEPPGSFAWQQWYSALTALYSAAGAIPWNAIDTTGSNITDIATRAHNSLQSLQGGTSGAYYHSNHAFNIQGAAIAAANNLTLGTDGDYFQITGATQINLIVATNWLGGNVVRLKFNSTPTVKHNQAVSGVNKPIILNGAVDFVAAASNILSLVYDSTDTVWYEVSRKV
jgi:hypothetical protein